LTMHAITDIEVANRESDHSDSRPISISISIVRPLLRRVLKLMEI